MENPSKMETNELPEQSKTQEYFLENLEATLIKIINLHPNSYEYNDVREFCNRIRRWVNQDCQSLLQQLEEQLKAKDEEILSLKVKLQQAERRYGNSIERNIDKQSTIDSLTSEVERLRGEVKDWMGERIELLKQINSLTKENASKIGVITPEIQEKAPIPTRQLCKRCMKYSGLAFRTPDETWIAVTDDRYQHLCLPCFVDMADERMIDWEPGLLIYGESMAHLRERQERVARGEYTDEGLTEWDNRSKAITEALTELVHLHACEQEGLQSGRPTPEQWFNAINKAHDALWPKMNPEPDKTDLQKQVFTSTNVEALPEPPTDKIKTI